MTAIDYARADEERTLRQLQELIAIPSVSTQPAHAPDVRRAAEWVAASLRSSGCERVDVIAVPGGRHPLVFATWDGAGPTAPRVLIYGHYDVQPADEPGWESPPFEPTIRDGKLYGRGATDSKVNVITQLKAVEALLRGEGRAPVNLALLFEGEEECGSESIERFVADHRDELACDVCVLCDGGILDPDQPSLVTALRGFVGIEIEVHGAEHDVHSGLYGGSMKNPIHALSAIIAALHDRHGHIAVPGFYDGVAEPTSVQRAHAASLAPWFAAARHASAGDVSDAGEPGFTAVERVGLRPAIDVNGIQGGYAGVGFKTVLPARALARLSCRLVPGQDPWAIYERVRAHAIASASDGGVRVDVRQVGACRAAVTLPHTTRAVAAAAAAYARHWGKAPLYEAVGGSVPIAYALQELCREMVIMSYGHRGGRNHAANEHVIIRNLPRGIATAIEFLHELGT